MADENGSRTSLQVLVVDDDSLTQRMIESVLKSMGITHVDLASDGKLALAKVRNRGNAYDLIITDVDMPNMTGMEFVKTFRKDHPNTTVVMLTARTDTKDFNEAKFMGVEYFFMKPITPQMLKIRLSAVMDVAQNKKTQKT